MKLPSQKVLFSLIGGLVVLVLLAGSGTLVAYNVYVKRDGSSFTRAVGGWLPVAKVGGHTIRYAAFLDTRQTVKTYLASEAARSVGAPADLTPEIERQALERLMREEVTRVAAEERKISVSDDDVRNSFDAMVASNSSTIPDVGAFLQKNYQWTEEEFRANVIKPAILEERLAATLTTSTEAQWTALETFMQDQLADSKVKIYLKFE